MAGWQKHPTADFHTWRLTPRTYLTRSDTTGAIILFVSAVVDEAQTTTSIDLGDEMRSSLIEALTTEPDDEGESR